MKNFNFSRMYGCENQFKSCLHRIVKTMLYADISSPDDSDHRYQILKKNMESLTPRDFELIWRYADPFSTGAHISDPHPNTPEYLGVWVNTIREISRIVISLLADHAVDKNPVWEISLAQTRWGRAIEILIERKCNQEKVEVS